MQQGHEALTHTGSQGHLERCNSRTLTFLGGGPILVLLNLDKVHSDARVDVVQISRSGTPT